MTRLRTGIRAVDVALEPLWRALENRLFGGTWLEGTLAAGVPKRFTHGLRRPWAGWVLTDTTGTSPVYRANTTTTDKNTEIWLQSAANTDIKFYLF